MKSQSISSKIMSAQLQQRHQQKLNEIYGKNSLSEKTINIEYFKLCSQKYHKKININDQINHHLTIKNLIKKLNSPKSYQDRIKDPHDFIAYPVLFFREIQNNEEKRSKLQKKVKPKKATSFQKGLNNNTFAQQQQIDFKGMNKQKGTKQSNRKKLKTAKKSDNSKEFNGLTLQIVKSELPYLKAFKQKDIEHFADCLTEIIFKYNLRSMAQIEFLFQCVGQYLPDHYPDQFIEKIQEIFNEIVKELQLD